MTSCSLVPAALLMAGLLAAQNAPLKPYSIDWKDNAKGLVSASQFLKAPAGGGGFVTVRDGHLYQGGKRFRIWGVNMTGSANGPAKEDAPIAADHLARFGINCVRMHFLDRFAPTGILAKPGSATYFDAERMDRLDFFIAQLKRRGIYVDLNLNVGRTYTVDQGVKDPEYIGFGKALTYFDERLLELQREYARNLLTHKNPYTGKEYRDEPAVALVEMVNENSIVESWMADRLQGKAARKNPGTWSDIPASYEQDLTAKYQSWLKAHNLPPQPRLRKAEFASADPERFRNEARFYMELEDRYFQSMYALLKQELGVKSLILGTSDHNHGISGYPLLSSMSKLDVVDGHVYWQHPKYDVDPATGRNIGFSIQNTPMVNDPVRSTPVQLARSAVAGKPYIVSEVNHPSPAEYAAEGVPILTAYALLQDWDGLFWYTFEHREPKDWQPRQPGHFEFRTDPVKMTQLAAGAFVFLRGSIKPAKEIVLRGYSKDQVIDSLRQPPDFYSTVPLQHRVRIESFERSRDVAPKSADGPIVADTAELTWHTKPGLVAVDAPGVQALIGFGGEQTATLKPLLDNKFAALMLIPLDAPVISKASRLLLATGSKVENTGMVWNEKRTSLKDWGTAPTVIEPVTGNLTLCGLKSAKSVTIQPLDGSAHRIGNAAPARKTESGWEVPLGPTVTPWYILNVQ